jgi:hypothetical protein
LAAALYGELCRQGQQHIPVYAHHSNGRVVHCDAGSPTAQDILTALEDNLNTLWQGTGRFRQMPAFQAAPTVLTPSLPILPNAGRLPLPPVPEGKPSLLRGTTRRDA